MLKKLVVLALTVTLSVQVKAQFANHGPQVFAAAIQGNHFLKDPKTVMDYIFTVVRGVPARLVGFQLKSGEMIVNSALEAEEKIPGGAKAVLESQKLNSYDIKAVVVLHVSPKYEVANVAIRAGKFMASSDEIFITVKGKGGHGAQPHLNIDPVVISSQLVISLQQIVSRLANPAIPSVLRSL